MSYVAKTISASGVAQGTFESGMPFTICTGGNLGATVSIIKKTYDFTDVDYLILTYEFTHNGNTTIELDIGGVNKYTQVETASAIRFSLIDCRAITGNNLLEVTCNSGHADNKLVLTLVTREA